MPTLLELQRDMRRCLIDENSSAIAASLAGELGTGRFDIYRNTIFSGLVKTLRLAFPAVERLVGMEFFEGTARAFIIGQMPRAAYLDEYGDGFPDFLRGFPPAASLPYLADVASLEWAVNRALHAPDETSLDLSQLAAIAPIDQSRVCFRAHASVSLLRSEFPADEIWRAVLDGDDKAMAALDLAAGPVFLLIERVETEIEVTRMQEPAWNFLQALCRGEPLLSIQESAADLDVPNLLAEHLAARRFAAFTLLAEAIA